jgi:hypothetical protein
MIPAKPECETCWRLVVYENLLKDDSLLDATCLCLTGNNYLITNNLMLIFSIVSVNVSQEEAT